MTYEHSVTLDLPYADAVSPIREALAEQGFGVLLICPTGTPTG
jgi:uncharacterized protein (DUF302 family)